MVDRSVSFLDELTGDWAHLQRLNGTAKPLRPWNFFHPRFLHIVLIRLSLATSRCGFPMLPKVFSIVLYILYRVELNTRARIKAGLVLPHPMGIVIGADQIGYDVLIFQNVTLGAKTPDVAYNPDMRPTIGDRVMIGAGAVVVGGVQIGNDSVVGANSLLTKSIPENSQAIGVPAQISTRKQTR